MSMPNYYSPIGIVDNCVSQYTFMSTNKNGKCDNKDWKAKRCIYTKNNNTVDTNIMTEYLLMYTY